MLSQERACCGFDASGDWKERVVGVREEVQGGGIVLEQEQKRKETKKEKKG